MMNFRRHAELYKKVNPVWNLRIFFLECFVGEIGGGTFTNGTSDHQDVCISLTSKISNRTHPDFTAC